jgi:hypothetical protein
MGKQADERREEEQKTCHVLASTYISSVHRLRLTTGIIKFIIFIIIIRPPWRTSTVMRVAATKDEVIELNDKPQNEASKC